MKALIQRVSSGAVTIEGREAARIQKGFVVFLGVRESDTEEDAVFLAGKTAALRIFSDDQERMNLSLTQVGGEVLVISQFTLHADTKRGNRPSFILAANPEKAKQLYERYLAELRHLLGEKQVCSGQFQADMKVEIINEGPVTIELRSRSEPQT